MVDPRAPVRSLGGRAGRREDRGGGSRLRLTARNWPGLVPFAAAYLTLRGLPLDLRRPSPGRPRTRSRGRELRAPAAPRGRALGAARTGLGVASCPLSNVYVSVRLVALPGTLIWARRQVLGQRYCCPGSTPSVPSVRAGVAHDVNGERRDVFGLDDSHDRERFGQFLTPGIKSVPDGGSDTRVSMKPAR